MSSGMLHGQRGVYSVPATVLYVRSIRLVASRSERAMAAWFCVVVGLPAAGTARLELGYPLYVWREKSVYEVLSWLEDELASSHVDPGPHEAYLAYF